MPHWVVVDPTWVAVAAHPVFVASLMTMTTPSLVLKSKAAMVVSHNPVRDGRSVWLNAGGIKRHHVVYSAGTEELAVFTRLGDRLRPLTYRAEPMLRAMSRSWRKLLAICAIISVGI